MSHYKDISELANSVLGGVYKIVPVVADDTKGRGSTQIRFTITPTSKDGGTATQIFAKENDTQGTVCEKLHVVEKESIMYDKVIPLVTEFLSERDPQLCSDIKSILVEYFGRGCVQNKHYFLFQDLFYSHCEKFGVNASDTFHDTEVVYSIMASLARFHGVFHSMKHICGFDFRDKHPLLAQNYLLDKNSFDLVAPFYNGEFHKSWKVLDVILDCYLNKSSSKVVSKLKLSSKSLSEVKSILDDLKLHVGEPLKLLEKIYQREVAQTSRCILIHGDFHPLNIAVSDNSNVKFFDFQQIRHGDGLVDIHQYICQGTTPKQRYINLPSFLETYHKTLTETCIKFGMPGSPHGNMTDFLEEYKKFSPWQIPFGFGMLIWKYVSDFKEYEKLPLLLKELESSTASEKKTIQENIIICIDSLGPNIWCAIQILFDYIIEIDHNGILSQIPA